jgi:NhaA family Na+:H+ antiporter
VWVCVLKSGVHATLAGVVTGLLIPHVDKRNEIDDAIEHSPLETLEHALHPWVAYAILPLFAFANAGLALAGYGIAEVLAPVAAGDRAGAGAGQADRDSDSRHAGARQRHCALPRGHGLQGAARARTVVRDRFHHEPVHRLAGVRSATPTVRRSVLGVLLASTVAAIVGYAWLRVTLRPVQR